MRVADFVKLHKNLMILLSNYNVKMDDFKYIDMFGDYELMVKEGNKVSYTVAYLAGKYDMSEASVYRVLRKFKVAFRF